MNLPPKRGVSRRPGYLSVRSARCCLLGHVVPVMFWLTLIDSYALDAAGIGHGRTRGRRTMKLLAFRGVPRMYPLPVGTAMTSETSRVVATRVARIGNRIAGTVGRRLASMGEGSFLS